ncbi:beta-phosphoglucomutase [Legionella londiniensis]|uniref:Beta-phosphoglucomutase n=1 Tax=Legionella londiniensis TaxID=45068 RepID=A0A0W0VNJ8_9GAMM|nr:beta-phosphoglucomutase [Legionella londiniensis]KTD21744.1 HAD-superfamily hydrolase [Legionella londiniensis]STX93419.1 HAD-superfamily hydrolase [Legionella londiniensis]
MTVKAVIFDLDGVITDTATYHFKAWQRLASEIGVSLTPEENEDLKGLDRTSSLNIILMKAGLNKSEAEKSMLAERKNRYYQEIIAGMTHKDIFPGAEPLLQALRQRKILIGLASASKNALLVLRRLGIAHYFDYIADASQIKNNKPSPEIFLTVADNLSVLPHLCIGVEDAQAGLQAIKAAGMKAIGIGDASYLKEADLIYARLADLNIEEMLRNAL